MAAGSYGRDGQQHGRRCMSGPEIATLRREVGVDGCEGLISGSPPCVGLRRSGTTPGRQAGRDSGCSEELPEARIMGPLGTANTTLDQEEAGFSRRSRPGCEVLLPKYCGGRGNRSRRWRAYSPSRAVVSH